jgi:hypothetical protein
MENCEMSDDESLEKHIQLDGREEYQDPFAPKKVVVENSGGGTPPPAKSPNVVQIFYRDLVMVLTEPRHFFEIRYPETSFAYAMTFGIIVAWIAAFLNWLTRIVRHETLWDGLMKIRDKLQELPFWKNVPENFWAQSSPEAATRMFPAWIAEVFGIVLAPFQAMISLTLYGIVIFIGCYLLVPKSDLAARDPVDVKHTIKVVSFASAPLLISSILGFLPLNLGSFFGWIYSFVLLIFALHVRFRVSKLRAFGVVVLPGVASFVAIGCVIGVFAGLFFGIIASLFGSMS